MNATHSKRDAAFTNAGTNIFETNIIETFCEKWLENEFEDDDLIEEDDDLFDDKKGHILLQNQPLAICDKTTAALQALGRDDIFFSESTEPYIVYCEFG